MKILIFGSNGMLGRYVTRVLSDHANCHTVIPLTRTDYNIETGSQPALNQLIDKYNNIDVIVNCAGTKRPQTSCFKTRVEQKVCSQKIATGNQT